MLILIALLIPYLPMTPPVPTPINAIQLDTESYGKNQHVVDTDRWSRMYQADLAIRRSA